MNKITIDTRLINLMSIHLITIKRNIDNGNTSYF